MKLAPLLAASFVVVALAESALGILQPRMIATDADWEAAAQEIRRDLKPTDLIVSAPAFTDQTARAHLGDVMPTTMIARSDDDRFARIWELSTHGAHAIAGAPVYEHAFGRVTLRRYETPAVTILRDLTTDFAKARLSSTLANGTETPCNGTVCGTTRVEPRVLEIDYQPRRGVLVPVQNGATTNITYDDVPSGKLVGYVGLHDYYARKSADGMVSVRISADETHTVTLPVRNGGEAWKRFELDLGPGTHTVRVEVSSAQPAWRNLGFHLEVRAP